MREYDQETLSRVQAIELQILRDFIDLCQRHGLQYFAFGGTGIGALRHGGFIPWDDDIDVCLLRKDYDKMLRYAKEELSDKYIVMNALENENYPLMTTRLMKKGTQFREYSLKDIDCPLGIFLDIYALDNISDDPRLRKKQFMKAWVFNKLLILRSIPDPVLGFRGWKAKLVRVLCFLAHWVLRICRVSKKYLIRKCMEAARMCENEETEYVDYLFDTTPYVDIFRKADIFPLQELPFEDMTVCFPKNLHENLTHTYGDYMQLPPEDKRKNHFPYALELGDEK